MTSQKPKVFCVGFQKTGTVTLRACLRKLGYRVCSARYDLIPAVREGDLARVRAVVEAYDAFRDNPWPLLFRELDSAYPASRFILSVREEKRWIKSVVNHLGVGPDRMQRLVYGTAFPGGFEHVYLQRFREHNADVVRHFAARPSDLLVVDWEAGDGWEKLCGFLGHEVPSAPFPHRNRGSYTDLKSRLNFAAADAVRLGRRLIRPRSMGEEH
jgi:hypothetical protein